MHHISEKEEIALVLKGSLLKFTSFFYKLLTGRDFIVSQPVGRESHHLTIAKALTKAARLELENHRLIINTPPGSGKSTLMTMFVAWTIAQYPDSKYIYVSYSKTLADKMTEQIKRIMSLREYAEIFDVHIRKDSKAKDYFQTENGGAVASAGSSGTITGLDAGLAGLDRFSGCLICFPYDEYVYTESGAIKIGEIVEKKMNVKVWSVNLEKMVMELKEIEIYFENPGSEIIEIGFEDGSAIRCTPDHKIWTKNRGWVEAQDLLGSDELLSPTSNCVAAASDNFSAFICRDRQIFNNAQLMLRQPVKFVTEKFFPGYDRDCFAFGSGPSSYCSNSIGMDAVHFRDIFGVRISIGYEPGLLGGDYMRRSPLFGRVIKIFNSIIKAVPIFMKNISFILSLAHKRCCNQSMNKNISFKTLYFCPKIFSFFKSYYSKLFDLSRLSPKSSVVSVEDLSFFGSNSSHGRGAIMTVRTGNDTPLFVRKIGHADKTYCLTVKDNHNIFVGSIKNNYKLCSNCDDLIKPDEAHSTTLREAVIENFSQTLVQRLRGKNVPIILIGQRVHEADISQYIIDGKDGYNWTKVIIKAIDEVGNIIYPEVYSREMLLKRKATDAYVFSSQYQQEPVPAGGALYKPEWFVLLDEEPKMLCTFVVADTAETSKTYNDATAISFFGVYKLEDDSYALHCIDALEAHVEPRELKELFLDFWNHCMRYATKPKFAAIEKKSTGVSLISAIQEIRGIRLIDIARSSASGSKTKRFLDAQPFIAERRVSFNRYAKHTSKCIEHMSKITANDSHARDDLADTFADAIRMTFIDKTVINSTSEETDYNELSKDLMSNSFHIAALRAKAYNNR